MIAVSDRAKTIIESTSRRFKTRFLYNETVVDGEIRSVRVQKGSCGESKFVPGSIYSSSLDAKIDNTTMSLDGKELEYQIGVVLEDDTVEWCTIGSFTVRRPSASVYSTAFTAYGVISAKMGGVYVTELSYPATIQNVLDEISGQTGVTICADGFDTSGVITTKPSGYTHREMLAFIAGLFFCYATEDSQGSVVLKKFSVTENRVPTDGDRTKELPTFSDTASAITGIKVIVSEETDGQAEVSYSSGIVNMTLSNPFMTKELFDANVLNVVGFSYYSGKVPITTGDFRLESSDCLEVTDTVGILRLVPCMYVSHTFDGGVQTEVIAPNIEVEGESAYRGPLSKEVERMKVEILYAEQILADAASIKYVEANYLKTTEADIKYSTIERADILQANINEVSGNLASFISGEFEALKSKEAIFENTTTEKFTAQQASIDDVSGNLASFISGEFEALKSKEAEFENTTTQNFTSVNAEIETVTGDLADYKVVIAGQFTAYDADILSLKAKDAELETAVIGKASIGDLDALRTRTGILESDYSALATIVNGNLTSENIHSLVIAGEKFTIVDGFIKNAMIESLVFEKITGVDIDTTSVKVHSRDGKSTWIDNTIQISDENRVRVQMGKDASGDYTLAVWDATGKLIWDALGATENTIQRAIIRDAVVADDANIAGSKLDIESVVREVNGATTKLKSTAILLDEKNQTLDVAFNEMENTVSDNLVIAKNYTDGMFDSVQIGGRNLIRNSNILEFDDYYFENIPYTAFADENGNVLVDENNIVLIA